MNKGFTLLELIVIVIIVGILASMAVPQYYNSVEKSRVAEAYGLLPVIAQSALRRAFEAGAYTTTIGNLDVEIPTPRFFTITLVAATPGLATNERIVYMTRNGTNRPASRGAYILSICENGRTYCTDSITTAGDDCMAIGTIATTTVCP